MGDATGRLGARRMYSDEFLAIVAEVLAGLPAPLVREADRDAVVAEVVARVVAVYPYPRQRPLIGFRAIIDAHGMESRIGRSARLKVGLYQFGLRRRGVEARRGYDAP